MNSVGDSENEHQVGNQARQDAHRESEQMDGSEGPHNADAHGDQRKNRAGDVAEVQCQKNDENQPCDRHKRLQVALGEFKWKPQLFVFATT